MVWWVGGFEALDVRPKIRQEMRKENEKKCLPKIVTRHHNHTGWDEKRGN